MHRDQFFFFYSLYFSRYQELHNVVLILYFVHMDVLIYYLVAALFFFHIFGSSSYYFLLLIPVFIADLDSTFSFRLRLGLRIFALRPFPSKILFLKNVFSARSIRVLLTHCM